PEQWWGTGVSARTDQYALGVMLFQMLTGSTPFRSAHYAELVQMHVHEKPPTLAEAGAEAPEPIEALVARMLAKSADDRFASMAELIEAGDKAFGATEAAPVPVPVPVPGRFRERERERERERAEGAAGGVDLGATSLRRYYAV